MIYFEWLMHKNTESSSTMYNLRSNRSEPEVIISPPISMIQHTRATRPFQLVLEIILDFEMSGGNKNTMCEKLGIRSSQTHLDSHAKLKNSLTSVSMKPWNPQRQNQHFEISLYQHLQFSNQDSERHGCLWRSRFSLATHLIPKYTFHQPYPWFRSPGSQAHFSWPWK